MDYKDKYNRLVEAIKVLQKINPSDEGIQNWVNDNVPELAESEDEKTRKALLSVVNDLVLPDEQQSRFVTWLEKLKVFTEHGDGLYHFGNNEFTYVGNTWDNTCLFEKQSEKNPFDYENATIMPKDFAPKVEQKPTWNEEDDRMFQSCIGAVATNDYYKGEEKEQIYDWLKSLKNRIKGE